MNQDHIATPEEEEAFNMVEQQSNLGKQILRGMKTHELDAYEQGIQEGMKRERALWELAKTSQEIEQPKPLTDEQICALMPYCHNEFDFEDFVKFARAIEAKLKEKNT
jgi:hypothetical protein